MRPKDKHLLPCIGHPVPARFSSGGVQPLFLKRLSSALSSLKISAVSAFIFFVSLGLFSSGCTKNDSDLPSKSILFSAPSSYVNGTTTKTSYSGIVGLDGKEGIDWVNGDLVRIYSNQAACLDGTTHYADYTVTLETASSSTSSTSTARISPSAGNGLLWGSGEHSFYAVYPSPTTTDMGSNVSISNNVINFTIPGTQTYIQEDAVLKPVMKYAYMWASATSNVTSSGVNLSFRPMFSAFQFFIDSADDPTMTLTSFSLYSASTAMWGTCRASMPSNSSAPGSDATFDNFPAASDENKKITVSFGSGVTVTKGTPISITVFALPRSYNDLTVSFTTSKGETKTLALKKENGTPITFEACHKYKIYGLGLPGQWTYYLSDISDISVNGDVEQTIKVTVKSYKTRGSASEGVAWKIKALSTAGDGTYVEHTDPNWPSWITLSAYEGLGSQAGEELTMKTLQSGRTGSNYIGRLAPTPSGISPLRSVTPVGTKEEPRDLCLYDISGQPHPSGIVSSITRSGAHTANCYVIKAPGWYCFPLVYGNAIDKTRGTGANGEYTYAYQSRRGVPYNNADNKGILSPYILEDGNLELSGNYDAVAVWHDVKWSFDFINNDSCEVIDAPAGAALPGCKYIRFYADPDKIIEGNVMIALMDKDKDKILWSWHIWVGAELSVMSNALNCNLGYTNPLQYVIVGTEARNSALKVEPQQGDATAVEFSVSQPSSGGGRIDDRIWSNTYYQWGRKDPFIGRRSVAERVDGMSFLFSLRPFAGNPFLWDGSSPDMSYNVIGFSYGNSGTLAYASKEMNGNLGEQIKNPHKLERSDMVARYDLWNYNNTGNTFATSKDHAVLSQKVGKTVYDPCPAGFSVPRGDFYIPVLETVEDDGRGWIKRPDYVNEVKGYVINAANYNPASWQFYTYGRFYGMREITYRVGLSNMIPDNSDLNQVYGEYWTAAARQTGQGYDDPNLKGGVSFSLSCWATHNSWGGSDYIGNGYFFVLQHRNFYFGQSIRPVLEGI